MKNELISQAAGRRLVEVRERITQLDSHRFGEMAAFVSSVIEIQRAENSEDLKQSPYSPAVSNWVDSVTDFSTTLRLAATGKEVVTRRAVPPPLEPFLEKLKARVVAREPVFDLLATRYTCPLNFSFPPDDDVREFVLLRLMSPDRARIEAESAAAVNSDDLLLRLNFVALHAAATDDLRFLDALNYYYELLPATWHPNAKNEWLLVSYLALYARALISRT
jgi:hypothetical protein